MIKKFEKRYLAHHKELQRLQWSNYFEGSKHDLSGLDEEIYNLVCSFADRIDASSRRGRVADLIIRRELVDKHPSISKLRNRIDDLTNYDAGIPLEVRDDGYKYQLEMARRMKDDVLQLMHLRDSVAAEHGYSSYVDLVLADNELDRGELLLLLNQFVDRNIHKAGEVKRKYNITFENWFDDLAAVSQIDTSYCPDRLIDDLLGMLGFLEVGKQMTIHYITDGFSGYAVEFSRDDIRVAVKPIESLDGLRSLFHEIGHGVFYSLNEESGLFRILPASLNEAMAVVFEYIAAFLLLDGDVREKTYELMTLEYTRCAISALFEFDLWENPHMAEALYERHYSKLGLKISDPSIWSFDSFRSIDPVYIHNYVVGASIAERLILYLNDLYSDDYGAWGSWLAHKIFREGSRRTVREMGLLRLGSNSFKFYQKS